MLLCLIEHQVCGKKYNGTETTIFVRAKKYKTTLISFQKEQKISNHGCNKDHIHEHNLHGDYNIIFDREIKIKGQDETEKYFP